MRISLDIGDTHLRLLDRLARRDQRSRDAMIGEAIMEYLARRAPPALDDAFGLWGEGTADGLEYQRQARREW